MCLEEEDHLVTARSGGVDAACCCGHSIKVPQSTQEEHPWAHHVHIYTGVYRTNSGSTLAGLCNQWEWQLSLYMYIYLDKLLRTNISYEEKGRGQNKLFKPFSPRHYVVSEMPTSNPLCCLQESRWRERVTQGSTRALMMLSCLQSNTLSQIPPERKELPVSIAFFGVLFHWRFLLTSRSFWKYFEHRLVPSGKWCSKN